MAEYAEWMKNKTILDGMPNSAVDNLIAEYIKSERDRKILHRRLIDGIVFEALAEEFLLSPRQTKTIVAKQVERLSEIAQNIAKK